jgi:uncharacterized protein involved in exopolysaccharide biosynthesis
VSWQDSQRSFEELPEEGAAGPAGDALPPFLLDPAGIVARRWLIMSIALVLGLAATVAVVSSWRHRYVAAARVVINSQQIPREFVRSTIAESSMAYLNAAVGKLLSRPYLERLIDEHGLYPQAQEGVPREGLVEGMRRDITVAPERSVAGGPPDQTAIVYRLSFESDSPQHAADVANSLAGLLLDATLEQRTEQARSVTRFLQQALQRDERELREQGQKLTDFRRAHRGELPSELEPSMRKLELLHDRRQSLATEIARTESKLAGSEAEDGERRLSENEALLKELRRRLAGEVAANTDDHPNVIALRRRVKDLEASVAEERAGSPAFSATRAELVLMRERLRAIDAESDTLVERIDRIPIAAEEIAALEQKEQVLRENYLSSLRKVEEAELAEALESAQHGAQIEILERARPPAAPKQSRWLLLAAGLAASLGLAVGVGVLLEFLDPVVLTARQIEALTERPVLGSLPRIAT